MNPEKKERNLQIVKLRDKDPKKWSWDALRVYFRFNSRGTVRKIYLRTKERQEKRTLSTRKSSKKGN